MPSSIRPHKAATKKCRNCKKAFTPSLPMQVVCCPACAIALIPQSRRRAEAKKAKAERAETRAAKAKLKRRSDYMREAQAAFNAFIRERDHDQPCISCGRHHGGQYHAGHYLSVGARPELRFEPLNVWRQCAPCNSYRSGNAVLYRQALVKKLGAEAVEWLEGPHAARHYTIDELVEIKRSYRAKCRELIKQREGGLDGRLAA